MRALPASVYLVEEVLHQVCDADVVEVAVSQQQLLQVLQFGDGVVAVPHRLAALLTLDAWSRGANNP